MKTKSRNLFLLILTFIMAISFMGIVSITAFADTQTVPPTFEMVGASIRLDDPTGIRFGARVDGTTYNQVMNKENNKVFGAIILPKDILGDIQIGSDNNHVDALKGKTYLDSINNNNYSQGLAGRLEKDAEGNPTGYYTISYSMTEVKFGNLNREFYGLVYIRSGVEGNYTYEYASIEDGVNVKTVAEVARKAYEDEANEYGEDQKSILNTYVLKAAYLEQNSNSTENEAGTYAAAYTVEDHDDMVELAKTASSLAAKYTEEGVSTFDGYSISKPLSDYNAIVTGKDVVNPALDEDINRLEKVKATYNEKYALLYESEDAFNDSKVYANGETYSSKTDGVDDKYGYYVSVGVKENSGSSVSITLDREKYNTDKDKYDVVYLPFYAAQGGYLRYDLNGSGETLSHASGQIYINGNVNAGWNYFAIPVSYLDETVMYGRYMPTTAGEYKFAMPILAKLNESILSTEKTTVYEIFDYTTSLNNTMIRATGVTIGSTTYKTGATFTCEEDDTYGTIYKITRDTTLSPQNEHYALKMDVDKINDLCVKYNVTSFSFYTKYEVGDAITSFGVTGAKTTDWNKVTINVDTLSETNCYITRTWVSDKTPIYISNFFIEVPVDEAA